MSDNEKSGGSTQDMTARHAEVVNDERPRGGIYYNTTTQVVMLGFVCFMGPGLFNALNGLGGGGKVTATDSANSNVALYSTFAFTAFFAGSINNVLGPRLTLLLGTTGYSLYIGSYLATNLHTGIGWFEIFAGAILGVCAGLLWTAQGSLMLAYPTEKEKGLFISIFWAIFNLGAVVGASVSVGQNIHNTANQVSTSTYVGFLVLTLIGVAIPMCMANPKRMYRSDGSKVTTPRHPSWKTEIYSLYLALVTDPAILLLFPLFFASNYFYTWQFNDFNGALFNIRTRSINSLIYWISQIFGSYAIGVVLDIKSLRRRTRAFLGWGILFAMVFIIHGWAYMYQRNYTRETVTAPDYVKMDYKDHGYAGRALLYVLCGLLDAMWQTAAYWFMGAMSNDPAKLAIFVGFYKSIQSAGGAGAWRADAVGTPFMNIFASTWALLAGGLLFALPMLYNRVKDHTEIEEEILQRMDDQGNVLDVSELKN
ncbi:hypothetical protein FRB96_005293 [Tulasnella sp. 330]|nr:hypothetical protein FRB96_005293 [Tulasnella sp. 330]KAG8880269.1 hypothetical protein FRB98_005225 [Tulasnella sp. 332]